MSQVILNMTHGWGIDPEQALVGCSASGSVSAALWASSDREPLEVSSTADPERHFICFQLNRFSSDSWIDGKLFHSGRHSVGTCNVIRAGQSPRAVISGPFRVLHIYLPTALLDDTAGDVAAGRTVKLIDPRCSHAPKLAGIANEILQEMRACTPLSALRVDVLGRDLAIQLLRHHSNLAGDCHTHTTRGGLAPWQVKRTCEAMTTRLDADLGLDDLAAIAGCSATHFSRAFKQSMGLSPFHWLAERRIEKAKELLEKNTHSLAEIALAVGFSAQPQFTTAFGRATGMTPGQWRRERLL